MNPKRIVITGGPGTGKSSIINELSNRKYTCYEEVSRQVTKAARKDGIDQLFLTKPLLFSELLLTARIKQFKKAEAESTPVIFYDRGLPDVLAYMEYLNTNYPKYFKEKCESNKYDQIFILPPWKAIYVGDKERYESFEQACQIHNYLLKTYERFNYDLTEVPLGPIEQRTDFIINKFKS